MTSAPTRAAATAAAVPAGPPPTTSTSVSANTGVSRAASRIVLAGRGRRSPLAPPKIARRPRRPSAPKISSPMSSATMFFDVSSVIRSSEPSGPLPGHGAQIELAQAAIDPQPGQFLLHAVLVQSGIQARPIHRVELLVLVEAREHYGLLAGHRVAVWLQALGADLLHHALHRRVDAADGMVLRLQVGLEHIVAGVAGRPPPSGGADRPEGHAISR